MNPRSRRSMARACRIAASPPRRDERVARADRRHLSVVAQIVALAVRAQALACQSRETPAGAWTDGSHDVFDVSNNSGSASSTAPRAKPERGPTSNDRSSRGIGGSRGLRDPVVLHDEQHRHAPDRGEIEAFVNQPLSESAVADEQATIAVAVASLPGERQSRSDAQSCQPARHYCESDGRPGAGCRQLPCTRRSRDP